MLDLKYVLENFEIVEKNNQKRGKNIDLSSLKDLAASRKTTLEELEGLRAKSNDLASGIPKASDEERPALIAQGKELKEKSKALEETLSSIEESLNLMLRSLPNILRDDVKEGKDDSENEVLREEGEVPVFDFDVKDHLELGEMHGMIDMQRAANVSGARFVYLKGDAVLLEFALVQYALEVLSAEGFVPVVPPHIINTSAMDAMGYLAHGGEEEVYHLKNDDQVLIGTSEQAIGPMHMNEILDAESLPMRYVGFSPCYRREAGSYGKDTKGILRVHQFDKIEMFSFTLGENSDEEHELLLSMQERLMKGLGLPYRVMRLCSGDTGTPSARTYDIETWMPSQNEYRETHSTSNTTDFQTRRLKTRTKHDGQTVFVHALNGTAFAVGRILIALFENNQRADGSIAIPEVLQKWLGKDVIGSQFKVFQVLYTFNMHVFKKWILDRFIAQ